MVKGKKHTTTPITFSVYSRSALPTTQGSTTNPKRTVQDTEVAFLRIENMKESSYTGEVIPILIKGYFKKGVKVQISSLPVLEGDGFVLQPLESEPQQAMERINNTEYATITWQTAISAIKEGKHPLSVEMEATLLFPQRSRSPFGTRFFQDDVFDDFFGSYRKKAVALTSPQLAVKAQPLPLDGKPAHFSGAIGNFSLEVSAEPTTMELGGPITRTMPVSGQGNFDRVTAPSFPEGSAWKTYSPSSEFLPDSSNYQGRKQFEQAIVARDGRTQTIPSLIFTYFDPLKEKYISRSTKPIPISIKQVYAAVTPTPQSHSSQKNIQATEPVTKGQAIAGLAPIHLQTGSFTTGIRPIFFRKWYLGLVGVCMALLLSSLGIGMRKRYLSKNPHLLTKRKLEGQLSRNIGYLNKLQSKDDQQEFLAGCRKTIQEQLGLIWKVKPSAITLDDLRKNLDAKSPLLAIFATAEQNAYGGLSLSKDEMANHLELLQQELGELQ